jgi:hypothetical protein
LSNEWLEKKVDSIIHEACLSAFVLHLNLQNSRTEKRNRAQKSFPAFLGHVVPAPLAEPLWEYAVAPELALRKQGGRLPDYWGTFILMALSEHLSEVNKGNKKNRHYKLCCGLIDLFRGKNKKRTDSLAREKIRQLQHSHPNWPQHISSLRRAFDSFLASRSSINS